MAPERRTMPPGRIGDIPKKNYAISEDRHAFSGLRLIRLDIAVLAATQYVRDNAGDIEMESARRAVAEHAIHLLKSTISQIQEDLL